MDSRGVTPVFEKLLAIGITLLFLAGMTATLFGGAVPIYRQAVGETVADRVLATATAAVESGVPPSGTSVDATSHVTLPATIRGAGYAIRVDGRNLTLDHPQRMLDTRSRPALPGVVSNLSGQWASGSTFSVTATRTPSGVVITIHGGRR
jgi:FlaG/FlaF family flagellin (archaellin)